MVRTRTIETRLGARYEHHCRNHLLEQCCRSPFLRFRFGRRDPHLADIASHVSENKDDTIRATKVSDDEVGLLMTRFNEMLEEIQKGGSPFAA